MATSARMTVSRSAGSNVARARSVSLSVSAAITSSRDLSELAALGVDHVLVSPRHSWDEATFDAIASILPEVHATQGRA